MKAYEVSPFIGKQTDHDLCDDLLTLSNNKKYFELYLTQLVDQLDFLFN